MPPVVLEHGRLGLQDFGFERIVCRKNDLVFLEATGVCSPPRAVINSVSQ